MLSITPIPLLVRQGLLLAVSLSVYCAEGPPYRPTLEPSNVAPLSILPSNEAIAVPREVEREGVQWGALINHSLRFLLIEHAFRYGTEPGTRNPARPFFRGYADSVSNLHGWSDGDPFYVNYVGHPMQGAVSGFLWTNSDTRYRNAEFGHNAEYWKSRLRAGAFAFVYSAQMEIGLLSEASIGNVQAAYPQQGFADHVITPAVGLGWMIAEDALDHYLVRFVERRTQNKYWRALIRGGANPSRSFANVVSGQLPWARPRDTAEMLGSRPPEHDDREPPSGVAPFEFAAHGYALFNGSQTCAGGGASAAFRVSAQWQVIADVNGCKIHGLEKNLSGDSLTYMAGPRWTPPISGRFVPYAHALFGGNKLSQELMLPVLKSSSTMSRDQYTRQFEANGFAIAAGVGVDLHCSRALALRLVGLEYTHSWVNDLNGFAPNGLQVKAGLVLRMGTW